MALINQLREKAGRVIVIAVALAIGSFILADLLGPNSSLFGNDNSVGEISGETISIQDYQQRVEEMKYNYTLNTGRNPSEAEMNTIRQQAWEMLIVDIAFQKEFDELGITVTEDEAVDMVQGKNIHPDLVQAFTDPSTGEFDKTRIVSFLQNFSQLPPQNQQQWYNLENNLETSRLRIKYDNLFLQTNYVTTAEAQLEHKVENTTAEVNYLYVPYYSISDSAVSVTDQELQTYLDNNKEQYKVEESRSISYITFPIAASVEDSTYFREELEKIKRDFSNAEDDSSFARLNTEGGQSFGTFNIGQLPANLQDTALSEGDVKGPFLENGVFTMYKISDVIEDTVSSARASHILFKADKNDESAREEAENKAEEALREIRNGADFETIARERSEDGSASRGGDLGWFTEGRMVAPFEDAVFGANNAGLINKVIETDFGYHVIKVTEPKTNEAYKIATIQREISASDDTRDNAFRKADYFAGTTSSLEEFKENAQADSLNIQQAEGITRNDRRIGGLSNARELVRWLYRDASKGEVSNVYELDDHYVVAVMTGKVEEGVAPLDAVRDVITTKVKNQKKAEQIISQLKGSEESLDAIAASFGTDAKVHSTSDLKLSSNSLPQVGFDPIAVGKAFSLEAGERTAPFSSENGVLIIEMVNKIKAPEIADYTAYKEQVKQSLNGQTSYNVSEAVKEFADIEDSRYKFY